MCDPACFVPCRMKCSPSPLTAHCSRTLPPTTQQRDRVHVIMLWVVLFPQLPGLSVPGLTWTEPPPTEDEFGKAPSCIPVWGTEHPVPGSGGNAALFPFPPWGEQHPCSAVPYVSLFPPTGTCPSASSPPKSSPVNRGEKIKRSQGSVYGVAPWRAIQGLHCPSLPSSPEHGGSHHPHNTNFGWQ